MPSKMSQKRSVSPSAGTSHTKRPRLILTYNKSINSGSTDNASIKTSTKTKDRPKKSTRPLTNQFVAINSKFPKAAARDTLGKLGAAERNAIASRMQPDDKDEALIIRPETNAAPPSDPINAINAPLVRHPLSNFGDAERRVIARWMRTNKAVGSRGEHEAAFQTLLYSLGCHHPSFDMETLLKFKHRLERLIGRIKKALKECGAICFSENDKSEKEPLFADWTVVWFEKDWDGVYDTRGYYTDNYLEKYSPDLEDGPGFVLGEPPVDEPFEEEVEILEVVDPTDFHVPSITSPDAGAGSTRDQEHRCNPYGMNDWKQTDEGQKE